MKQNMMNDSEISQHSLELVDQLVQPGTSGPDPQNQTLGPESQLPKYRHFLLSTNIIAQI